MTASAPLNFDGTSTVPGGFRVRGVPERIIGWDRIGEFAHRPVGLPPEGTPGLEATVFFRQDHPAWSFGAAVAVVTIDRDTGQVRLDRIVAVDDRGNAMNPLLVEGQVVGGLAQGIGHAVRPCPRSHRDAVAAQPVGRERHR